MRWSIQTILIAGVTSLIVVLVTVIMLSSYWRSEEALTRLARNIMGNISEYTVDKTEGFLSPAMEAADLARKLTNSEILREGDSLQMSRFFHNQLTVYPHFAGIYIGRPDGSFIYVNRDASRVPNGFRVKHISIDEQGRDVEMRYFDETFSQIDRVKAPSDIYDPRDRPWYRSAIKTDELIWTPAYLFFTSQKPGVTAARSVYGHEGNFVGVVGIDIEIGELSSFISRLKIGRAGKALVIDQHGKVIAFPEVEKLRHLDAQGQVDLPQVEELQDQVSGDAFRSLVAKHGDGLELAGPVFTRFNSSDTTYHAMFTPFKNPKWPWIIGVYLPEDDFLAELKLNQVYNGITATVITLMALLLVMLLSSRIKGVFRTLTDQFEAVRNLEVQGDIEATSKIVEVRNLSESFNHLKQSLRLVEQYVPKEVVRSLLSDQNTPDKEQRNLSVLFTDIEGFSSIAEQIPAQQIVEDLNEYFEEIARSVHECEGTIDKYIGDSVMAFWGAPRPVDDHARRACDAALLIRDRIARLNRAWKGQYKHEFRTRIGICTGDVVIGNIGSTRRTSYTVIGDNVNLASRLERLNKEFATQIILDEATRRAVGEDFVVRRLGFIQVRGKSKSVAVYELVGLAGQVSESVLEGIHLYERVAGHILRDELAEARDAIKHLDPEVCDDLPLKKLSENL